MAKIKRLTMTGDSKDAEPWGPTDTPGGMWTGVTTLDNSLGVSANIQHKLTLRLGNFTPRSHSHPIEMWVKNTNRYVLKRL